MESGMPIAQPQLVQIERKPLSNDVAFSRKRKFLNTRNQVATYRLILAFLTLLSLVYVFRVGPPEVYPAWGFDSSISLVSAKALAEGHGPRLINHPDEPLSPYVSIGYPALLALGLSFLSLDSVGITILRAISTVSCLIFLFLSFQLLRRYISAKAAAVAILFVGFQPWVVVWAGELFRECPFAMWITAAVLLARRGLEGEGWPRVSIVLAGLSAGLAMLTHSLGLAVIGGIAVVMALNRRWRSLTLFGLSSGLTVVPYMVWSAFVAGGSSTAGNYLSWAAHYYHWWTPFHNLWQLFAENGAIILFPPYGTPDGQFLLGRLHISWIFPVLSLLLSALALTGLVALLKRFDIVAWCLVFYLALVVLYPAGATRYLMPVYAFLAIPIFTGVKLLREQIGRLRIPSSALTASMATLLTVMTIGSLITNAVRISNVYLHGNFYGAWGAKDWRELNAAFDWIKENVPEDGIVVTLYSCSTYLFTGRKTISPYHDPTDSKTHPSSGARLEEVISKIRPDTPLFVFARPFKIEQEDLSVTAVKDFIKDNPEQARLRWETPDHRLTIYEVTRPDRL